MPSLHPPWIDVIPLLQPFTSPRKVFERPTAARPMAAHLEDVSTDDLIREVQRRIECSTKPEKHVVLIGELRHLSLEWLRY